MGLSGSGKSSLLRCVNGLNKVTRGKVLVHDGNAEVDVARCDPETLRRLRRNRISMVFQQFGLMPWLTVRDNVKFGLEGYPKSLQAELAAEAIAKVGLEAFAEALPKQLSGGMAQRVALARALVTKPPILLLDEPFSALDAFTRLKLQDHLLEIWAKDRPTMLFVTHDVDEALALSDRVVVMRGHPGRVHREYAIDLPRPRARTDTAFQAWKTRLLDDLDLSAEA
jgi:sulfonate transport system ATP-binding protein